MAEHKTAVTLMIRAHMPLKVSMQIGSTSLVTQKAVKYLGIQLDCKLTFWAQLRQSVTTAANVTGMLSRLMTNIGGPTQSKITLVLLYSSEVWGVALDCKTKRKALKAVQRTAALRDASAYGTVLGAAVYVISGKIPVDLMTRKRMYAWYSKKKYATISAAEWRCQPSSGGKADGTLNRVADGRRNSCQQ